MGVEKKRRVFHADGAERGGIAHIAAFRGLAARGALVGGMYALLFPPCADEPLRPSVERAGRRVIFSRRCWPLAPVAGDLLTGREVGLDSGLDAIRASIIPFGCGVRATAWSIDGAQSAPCRNSSVAPFVSLVEVSLLPMTPADGAGRFIAALDLRPAPTASACGVRRSDVWRRCAAAGRMAWAEKRRRSVFEEFFATSHSPECVGGIPRQKMKDSEIGFAWCMGTPKRPKPVSFSAPFPGYAVAAPFGSGCSTVVSQAVRENRSTPSPQRDVSNFAGSESTGQVRPWVGATTKLIQFQSSPPLLPITV